MTRAAALATLLPVLACSDLSSFSTGGNRYQGSVVAADFVLAGMASTATLCLTLDADRLQEGPGSIWTSDGRFTGVALRPIPQIWHDPLSSLSFGQGRLQNLVYVAAASTPFADGNGNDVFVVVSLMQAGNVEVRLLRGAPGIGPDGGPSMGSGGNLFAVFSLSRQSGPCSF